MQSWWLLTPLLPLQVGHRQEPRYRPLVAECKPEPRLSQHHIALVRAADSTLGVLVEEVAVVLNMSRIDPGTHMCVEMGHWIVGKPGLLNVGLASEMGLEYIQMLVAEIQEEDSAGTVPGPEHASIPHELGYEVVVLAVGSWLRFLLSLYRGCT